MTDQNYRARPFSREDDSDWFRLRTFLWDELNDDDHQTEMLDIYSHSEIQLVLMAETGEGQIVGFIEASIRPFVEDCHSENVGCLEGWFVESQFRSNGISGKLVKSDEDWARKKGCTKMASDSEIRNDSSLAAHQKLGY